MTTRIEPRVRPRTTDGGDHDRFAHYILADDPQAAITEAMVTGKPLRALCGKVWVPSRDATRYPVCPECAELKKAILSHGND